MLQEAGLPPDQERAYRALVQLGSARPADLARQLSTEERQATKLLEALVDVGLATQVGPEPVYAPLSPDVALGTALVRRQEALETARREVAQLTEEYRNVLRRHDADQLVEIVHGRQALRQRLEHLQRHVAHEMRWFCRANPVALESEENSEEFAALRRGVRYRVLYERSLLEEPGMIENVAKGIRCGEHARALPTLPVRLGIVDDALAVCPLVPDGRSGEPTAAVIGQSQLLDALVALFESYWERASPVTIAGDGSGVALELLPDQLDEQERLVLSLFVAGLPDKAIASQLEVSRRTVQRRLGDLMARAGVDTRPGLAYQAARRDWV